MFWDSFRELTLQWFVVSCRAKGKCQSKIQGTSFVGTVSIVPLISQKYPQIYLLDEYLTVEFTVDTVEEIPNNHLSCIKSFLNCGINHQRQLVSLPDF